MRKSAIKRNAPRGSWARLKTEAIHPRSRSLHEMPGDDLLELMASEDRGVVDAVEAESKRVQRAARLVAEALGSGKKVFFVGAGTSGRLGVLEAAECPPTFGTDPVSIQAIMAGGRESVFQSREGAEDDEDAGAESVRRAGLARGDVLVGISASSVTPFVRGALDFAHRRGARRILVTCGRRRRGLADVVVAPAVGPEILAGSTRMKAGTATKMVLNQVSLLAMIALKKVHGPYMVDLKTSSRKLEDRARRMVAALAPCEPDEADRLLDASRQEVKTAVAMAWLDSSPESARRALRAASGDLGRIARSRKK